MAREKDGIKVQVSHRLDDRLTVTIKLIGWKAGQVAAMDHQPFLVNLIKRRVKDAVIESFRNVP